MSEDTYVEKIIQHFRLQPLAEEGGFYSQTYIADEFIPGSALPRRYARDKTFGTAIYYLLTADINSFSAMHRLPTDEIYHFYLGDPVELLLLAENGESNRVILGQRIFEGQHVQFVVPKHVWQGSHLLPGGEFALMGTTMAPGFDVDDFTIGNRQDLISIYPGEESLIRQLTRLSTDG